MGFISSTRTWPGPSISSNAAQVYIAMSKTLPPVSPAYCHTWDTNGTVSTKFKPLASFSSGKGALPQKRSDFGASLEVDGVGLKLLKSLNLSSHTERLSSIVCKAKEESEREKQETGTGEDGPLTLPAQLACWAVSAIYAGWLFILPYAPGDPVWAISPATIQMLIDLSLNFFFVLPLTGYLADLVQRGVAFEEYPRNDSAIPQSPDGKLMFTDTGTLASRTSVLSFGLDFVRKSGFLLGRCSSSPSLMGLYLQHITVGIHGLAPVLHPMDEGLFNLVIGWTLLFAPLLFTDRKRDRFGGSLEALWLIQMLLTNTVLAPYMAIRLNPEKATRPSEQTGTPRENRLRRISEVLIQGAKYVGIAGAAVGLISLGWALYGRPEGGFGGIEERWEYLLQYISRERLAYAFVWDICLYTIFQPWLIGDNLSNVREENREMLQVLRFVPYVGLVAYVLGLREEVKKIEVEATNV